MKQNLVDSLTDILGYNEGKIEGVNDMIDMDAVIEKYKKNYNNSTYWKLNYGTSWRNRAKMKSFQELREMLAYTTYLMEGVTNPTAWGMFEDNFKAVLKNNHVDDFISPDDTQEIANAKRQEIERLKSAFNIVSINKIRSYREDGSLNGLPGFIEQYKLQWLYGENEK